MKEIPLPSATYRLQFTPQFGFQNALDILPYLHRLGISHIYASPITRPRKGSLHGYDVCDHETLNPELGTPEEFETLLQQVRQRDMGWIQDIVPNHMAYSHENPYVVDVWEHGEASRYARFFDINWEHQQESLRRRVLAPFLGKPYGRSILDGEFGLVFENGGIRVTYYDHRFPLSPESYWTVLEKGIDLLESEIETGYPDYTSFVGALHALQNLPGADSLAERSAQCSMAKSVVSRMFEQNGVIHDFIESRLREYQTGSTNGNHLFDELMVRQNYRLSYWKVASEELNYRRFFTIGDLICIRAESEEVFEKTHALLFKYIDSDMIHGIRVDHIDGLFQPALYLKKLRERAPGAYIVVEKILGKGEMLPSGWPVQGTTGYDFLNYLHSLFCYRKSRRKFNSLYGRFLEASDHPDEIQLEKKRLIIGKHMAGDIDNLAQLIRRITAVDLLGRDITQYGLRRAIVEVLTHFPVYRTYISMEEFSDADAATIARALSFAREAMPGLALEFDFIERFLMMEGKMIRKANFVEERIYAVMRFQQFTGPLMAKGFEDTYFYVYNRFVSLNEVGGWPQHFGISDAEFQAFIRNRMKTTPGSMNPSSTHDTKRGEDTRARLNVLSEMPDEWKKTVLSWLKMNSAHLIRKNKQKIPDKNDRYLFYQTLVGTFPSDGTINETYRDRIQNYMLKAVREAKVHTAWIKPDEQYEEAICLYVQKCLNVETNSEFIRSLADFAARISWYGMLNSLSMTVLKMTLPGIPDFYQGRELWDFTLVDPDNRMPVDYSVHEESLKTVLEPEEPFASFMKLPNDGRIKMWMIQKCLELRREHRLLFNEGGYLPLAAAGHFRENGISFLRTHGSSILLVVVPRFTSHLVDCFQYPLGGAIWRDSSIQLPGAFAGRQMSDIFTGETIELESSLQIGDLLKTVPVSVWIG